MPAADGTARRHRLAVAADVAHEPPVRMVVRQRQTAARTHRDAAAFDTGQHPARAAAVEIQDGLLPEAEIFAQGQQQRLADDRGIALAQLALHVDDLDGRQRSAVIALRYAAQAKSARNGTVHALDRRRGGAEHRQRMLLRAAVDRDLAGMVARCIFGLVGVLLLLVHNEQTEVPHRREHG